MNVKSVDNITVISEVKQKEALQHIIKEIGNQSDFSYKDANLHKWFKFHNLYITNIEGNIVFAFPMKGIKESHLDYSIDYIRRLMHQYKVPIEERLTSKKLGIDYKLTKCYVLRYGI